MRRTPILEFIQISRPIYLLGGILMYALGAGIADYLGAGIRWNFYLIGQACVLMLQLASLYLKAFYDLPMPEELARMKNRFDPDHPAPLLTRQQMMIASVTVLTAGALLTVMLFAEGGMNAGTIIVLGFAFLLAFFYGVPPQRLAYQGYGELIESIIVASLTPALAFILQRGEIHRLLPLLTFPLTALYLAMGMARSLEGYAQDLKLKRVTIMIRIGWQRGMVFHNSLILVGYLLLGAATSITMPGSPIWPGLLTLPFGLFQIWLMEQISRGAKPRWSLLNLTALATVGVTAYLLALSLWTG